MTYSTHCPVYSDLQYTLAILFAPLQNMPHLPSVQCGWDQPRQAKDLPEPALWTYALQRGQTSGVPDRRDLLRACTWSSCAYIYYILYIILYITLCICILNGVLMPLCIYGSGILILHQLFVLIYCRTSFKCEHVIIAICDFSPSAQL